MLKSEASLSSYCDSDPVTEIKENLERTVTIGDAIDGNEFTFAKHKEEEEEDGIKMLGIDENDDDDDLIFEIERPPSPPMHLAAGLGIDKFDLYIDQIKFDLPGFDDENCGDYYKEKLEEYPFHPLLLKNYAKFLEYKEDFNGAEEYYHKCTIVEPNDGVALADYGRLVMKLYQDEAKAMSYFKLAIQASPEDSDVLGAYANFLWEVNAEDDDDDDDEDKDSFGDVIKQGKEESKTNAGEIGNTSISKTEDGETLCRYAKAFWSIKGDQEKALFYFEKAIEASPNDSIILGEYARFLWEIDE